MIPPRSHREHHNSSNLLSQFGPRSENLLTVGSRRWFLQTGLGGLAGLSAASLLQQQAVQAADQAGLITQNSQAKSVIFIWLSGGPSQLDMWDMKPNAPRKFVGRLIPSRHQFPELKFANTCRSRQR
ncbi:MAG: DUF1501 domain-containing protein [Planctomycetaceae bacterium]